MLSIHALKLPPIWSSFCGSPSSCGVHSTESWGQIPSVAQRPRVEVDPARTASRQRARGKGLSRRAGRSSARAHVLRRRAAVQGGHRRQARRARQGRAGRVRTRRRDTGARARPWRRRIGSDGVCQHGARTDCRQADPGADRGLPDRLRGRLRQSTRRRRGRPRRIRRARGRARLEIEDAARVFRDSNQAAVEGTASAQPSHARHLRFLAARRRREAASAALLRHHPQGDDAGARADRGAGLCGARASSRPARPARSPSK